MARRSTPTRRNGGATSALRPAGSRPRAGTIVRRQVRGLRDLHRADDLIVAGVAGGAWSLGAGGRRYPSPHSPGNEPFEKFDEREARSSATPSPTIARTRGDSMQAPAAVKAVKRD